MMRLFLALALLAVSSAIRPFKDGEITSYEGYKVIEITPKTTEDLNVMKQWMFEQHELDFWEAPRHKGQAVEILTPPHYIKWLKTQSVARGMHFQITNDNVQRAIDAEMAELEEKKLQKKAYDNRYFNTYEDIMSEIEKLARECPSPYTCEVYTIGQSYQGRDLNVLKISLRGANRKAYWLDSAIHAREWIAPATVMRIAEHDRYWRKNARPFGSCFGADLNRNYDYRWGTEGVSTNPCSDLYCGPSAASEPETQAVQNEVMKIRSSLLSLVTVHAYGNMFMHPWGNTIDGWYCERAADHDDMYAVAQAAGVAIQNTYNTRWSYGTSCEVIYETTGGTDDWAKAKAGVKYTFCPELRGSNFVINRSQIEPSFRELWNGIYAMVNQISAQEGV